MGERGEEDILRRSKSGFEPKEERFLGGKFKVLV